jgi:hypothetical protein
LFLAALQLLPLAFPSWRRICVPRVRSAPRARRRATLEGELTRLRRLEASHLEEVAAVKRVEQEKVDNLNQQLGEVDDQCRRIREEVDKQSSALTATAKRWVEEISALDRCLAGKLSSIILPASGCRLPARILLVAGSQKELRYSPSSGWWQAAFVRLLPPVFFDFENFPFSCPFPGLRMIPLAGTCRLLSAGFSGFLTSFATFAATFPEAQEAAWKAAGEAREARR